eukprot:3465815-Prorocentrum_lima.AAC.1
MTSSLVGSEMCIRDRFRNPPIRRGGHAENREESGSEEFDEVEDNVAVSYTHLTLPTICSV